MKSCNDVMTKNPFCCLASDPVWVAADIMRHDNVGAVPVVQDLERKKLIGIITDRDIAIKVVASDKNAHVTHVSEVMAKNPVTCRPDDHVQTAIDRMAQHQVRRMPVVDGKGCIVGIIAQADVATRIDAPVRTKEMLEDISQDR